MAVLGCASPNSNPTWQSDIARFKQENGELKEQLRVAKLQVAHLEKRVAKYRALEEQIFANIENSFKDREWELLKTQVEKVVKDFSGSDQRVIRSMFYLAELSRQLGHYTFALQCYDWLNRNPSNKEHRAGTYLGMGLIYGQMGLHKQAQEYFSTILEKHPNSSEAVFASREISDLNHLQGARGNIL
jgi:tetratricopeptide (TPR) repeat protein